MFINNDVSEDSKDDECAILQIIASLNPNMMGCFVIVDIDKLHQDFIDKEGIKYLMSPNWPFL